LKNLLVYEKCLDLIKYGTIALRQFPKYEKFCLAALMREQQYKILGLVVEANKKYHKQTTLRDLDIAHETLRVFVELAHRRLKYIDHKKYLNWMERVDELGRIIGGWMRSQGVDGKRQA